MSREKSFIERVILVLVGHVIIGTGVGLFLHSGLGADPNGVFISGIGAKLGVNYGISSMILNSIIIGIIFFVDKRYINVASILGIFSIGFTADFVISILMKVIPNPSSLPLQVLLLVLGGLFMCIGIVIYIHQKIGIAAFDAISEIISNKTNRTYDQVRIVMDLTALVIGYLLGGVVGVGTIYLALTTGPLINLIRKLGKVEQPLPH